MRCTSVLLFCFFFFKQKTAYEMRISDWSSEVCSSDLLAIAFVSGDRAAEIGDRVAGGAAHLRQKVAAERLAVLAEIDAEGGADRAGGQLEQEIGRASCRERVCQSV